MTKFLLSGLLLAASLFFLNACESKEEREKAKEAIAFKDEQVKLMQSAKEADKQPAVKEETTLPEPRKETRTEEDNQSILHRMGIESGEGKLVIDTHKTKEFFLKVSDDLKEVARDIKKEINENNLTITRSIGIEQNGTALQIDLNKTKSFFEDLGKRVDDFVNELNTTN